MATDVQSWDVVRLVQQGGVLMWPIFLCSIVALGVAIDRFISLRRARLDTRDLMDAMRTTLRQNRIQDAIDICDAADTPFARIVKAGVLKHDRSKDDIRRAIEEAARIETPRLERHMPALATCSSVAPLLGLLGTVQGMIKCFAQIQNKLGQLNPADLAGGIMNALITTFAGLAVAIPALVVYNYFVTRVDNLILEMEISSSEVLELLTQDRGTREV